MSNNSNNSSRSANRVQREFMAHRPFGHIAYIRNLPAGTGKGGADVRRIAADAMVVGVISKGQQIGLARTILDQYPQVDEAFADNPLVPGQVLTVETINPNTQASKTIVLACVKETKADKPKDVTIMAILEGIRLMIEDGRLPIKSIVFSKLGCGPEQLDWSVVGRIFATVLDKYQIRCTVVGIKDQESVFVMEDGKTREFTRDMCISRDQIHASAAPAKAVVVVGPAPKPIKEKRKGKGTRTRAPRHNHKADAVAPVSTEAKEEPCGMFRDATAAELNARPIPEADQALDATLI